MGIDEQASSKSMTTLYVKLMKGPLTSDQHSNLWSTLLLSRSEVVAYFDQIGLEVYVNEEDGFAFLKQREPNEDEDFPRLIMRRPLSFHLSVLCAILRRKLLEFDTNQAGTRAIVDREEIYQLMGVFVPEKTNEKAQRAEIGSLLKKADELGVVSDVPGQEDKIEIRRVIKALVNGEWLSNLNTNLEQYREYGSNESRVQN